ncbi:hypothetical protein GCM10027289_26570 [Tsukamurella serpentis]
MRKPLIALALSGAAVVAGIGAGTVGAGAAGADPTTCPAIPRDRIDGAISSIAPPLPDAGWRVTDTGGSIDCTLNWVRLDTGGGTGSSPVQYLLFDHLKFAGTPTTKPNSFTSVIGSSAPGQITVQFRWLNPGDATAYPTGRAEVRYQRQSQSGPKPIDPLPPQIKP